MKEEWYTAYRHETEKENVTYAFNSYVQALNHAIHHGEFDACKSRLEFQKRGKEIFFFIPKNDILHYMPIIIIYN